MNTFRTTFDIPKSNFEIDYSNGIVSLGSCFAEHIAKRLDSLLFKVVNNPNGIIFNPLSLAQNLDDLLVEKTYAQEVLVEKNGLWNSWSHHHLKSGMDAEQMINEINQIRQNASHHLKASNTLLVTLGSAFAYKYKATGKVVANCHKFPSDAFDKIRLSEHTIVGAWQDILDKVFQEIPDMRVIITVSPVRHKKDGLVANQRSKSILLLAVERLCQQYTQLEYFPAYEIMMDDLRDYRFYQADMIHPSDEAIDYIWNHFRQTYFTADTQSVMKEVGNLVKAQQHRPHHPSSDQNLAFKANLHERWDNLITRYPFLEGRKAIL